VSIVRSSFFQSFKSLFLFTPVAFIPLLLPSGETRSWYDIGRGWPWHYGWQATDLPSSLPFASIGSIAAFFGDFLVGVVATLTLWLLVRYIFARRVA
jgi:hypothetical protein